MAMTTNVNTSTRLKLGRQMPLRQLVEMQGVLYEVTMDETTKPADKASCSKAWEVLEERKRILRGKLKPGSWTLQPRPSINQARSRPTLDVLSVARLMNAEERPEGQG